MTLAAPGPLGSRPSCLIPFLAAVRAGLVGNGRASVYRQTTKTCLALLQYYVMGTGARIVLLFQAMSLQPLDAGPAGRREALYQARNVTLSAAMSVDLATPSPRCI